MRTAHSRGEHGQVLSSVVAVAAVVAVVIGLLVLFGTGGPGGGSDDDNTSGSGTSGATTSAPSASTRPTTPPSSVPSTVPSSAPSTVPSTPQPTTRPTRPPTTRPTVAPTTSEPTSEPTQRPTALGPRPSVEIYNNTTQRGLADRVADRARANGWRVAGIDNWKGKVAASSVYYPLGMHDHATALAADLGVGRVKPALDNMKNDRLTVILTSDYSG